MFIFIECHSVRFFYFLSNRALLTIQFRISTPNVANFWLHFRLCFCELPRKCRLGFVGNELWALQGKVKIWFYFLLVPGTSFELDFCYICEYVLPCFQMTHLRFVVDSRFKTQESLDVCSIAFDRLHMSRLGCLFDYAINSNCKKERHWLARLWIRLGHWLPVLTLRDAFWYVWTVQFS